MITWDFYKYNVCFLDDPYYCGLRARIPNFVKSRKKKLEEKAKKDSQSSSPQAQPHVQAGQQRILPAPTLNSMSGVNGGVTSTNPLWWHSRLYSDLGPLGSMNFLLIMRALDIKGNHFLQTKQKKLYATIFLYLRSWTRCTTIKLST